MRLTSDKPDGPTAGTHTIDALEFLALLLTHVPDFHEVLVRYYGAYSVRRRAAWRRAGLLTESRPSTDSADAANSPTWPQLRALRQRWAQLLQRIFEVDPLRCPRCGGDLKVLAFVLDPDVIAAILRHLRKSGRDPRALPEHGVACAGRAPP